ncbi:MAG: T9SS type A sorting domain-containing protein [Flavobacteriales bacterium]|nr:T9SS type A sorting domain-containing protein [Flavobacteriales bacterium]
MKETAFTIAFMLFIALGAVAQNAHCGTSEKMQELFGADPSLAEKRKGIEEFTARWTAENQMNVNRDVVTIPVVVHVVYNTPLQNISDTQIQSQIQVLNEDYRGQNADISGVPSVWTNLVADCEIQFALATCDPNGYATNGITRTQTDVSSWNGSDDVKKTALGGHDPWPTSDYMNIWVCNVGSGILGYAYQPGVSASLDGVVIGYKYFGRPSQSSTYNKGRTSTHEIGHYFNLDHPWGTGTDNINCTADDNVADTPITEGPNYDCDVSFPHITCSNGPNGDMVNNYMDYGDDPCIFFFTNGQKARMLAAINGPRQSLLNSNGLNQCPLGLEEHVLESSINVYPNPVSDALFVQSDQRENLLADIRIIDLSGREILNRANVRLGHAATSLDVSQLSAGTYVLEIRSQRELLTHKFNIIR